MQIKGKDPIIMTVIDSPGSDDNRKSNFENLSGFVNAIAPGVHLILQVVSVT